MPDAQTALGVLEGKALPDEVAGTAELLATVAGQDAEEGDDGRFRIRWGVAKDRVISTSTPRPATAASRSPILSPSLPSNACSPSSR